MKWCIARVWPPKSVNISKVGTFVSYCLVLVFRLQCNNVFFKDSKLSKYFLCRLELCHIDVTLILSSYKHKAKQSIRWESALGEGERGVCTALGMGTVNQNQSASSVTCFSISWCLLENKAKRCRWNGRRLKSRLSVAAACVC